MGKGSPTPGHLGWSFVCSSSVFLLIRSKIFINIRWLIICFPFLESFVCYFSRYFVHFNVSAEVGAIFIQDQLSCDSLFHFSFLKFFSITKVATVIFWSCNSARLLFALTASWYFGNWSLNYLVLLPWLLSFVV